MLRLGLVTYLALATTAGPWLCCCTAARFITSPDRPCKNESEHRPGSPNCCCHETMTSQDSPAPSEKEQPTCPPCPCKQSRTDAALSITELTGSAASHLRLLASDFAYLLLPADTQSSVILNAVRSTSGDCGLLPFLALDDILFKMHMLRC